MESESDKRFEEVLERFIPTPASQAAQDALRDGQALDGQGAKPDAYARYRAAVERLEPIGMDERERGYAEIANDKRHRAFEAIREVLEDSGIPFPRANALAERCFAALGEIL